MTARTAVWFNALCFLFLAGIVVLGYLLPRSAFGVSFIVYGGLFLIYGWLYRYAGKKKFTQLLILGIFLRIALLFSLPQWSDDYARFVWDGNLVLEGANPYLNTPAQLWHEGEGHVKPWMEESFSLLNSPNYYSVYPPLNQVVFGLAAYLSGGSLITTVLVIRLILIGFEIWVFYLIYRLLQLLKKPAELILLYVFNPLVIMEIAGNLHFEGMMLAFMLAGMLFLVKEKILLSGGILGAAVAVKLSPILFLPVVVAWLPSKSRMVFLAGFGSIAGLSTLPLFLDGAWYGFLTSLNLYSETFEFNASIYYLLRQIGFWLSGYNMIAVFGPMLKLLTLVLILWISVRVKKQNPDSLFEILLIIYWVYFLLNTVIHPWYILPAFAISLFTERKAMMGWSFLIFLSYQAYGMEAYKESPWVLGLEYLGVFVMLYLDYGKGRGRVLNTR